MAQRSLRDQQQELTRELIFQALVDVILEEGVHAFTVQRVAERAGISPRTIYRHFPTREALLDQIGDWAAEQNAKAGLNPPESVPELADHVRRLFRAWDAEEAVVRAIVILRITTGMQPRERKERVQRLSAAIDDWAPHASEQQRAWASSLIRTLASTVTWTQMRTDLGLTGAEAGDAVGYAIDLVLGELKRRSDEARSTED